MQHIFENQSGHYRLASELALQKNLNEVSIFWLFPLQLVF